MEVEAGTLAGAIPSDVARVLISSMQWRASKLAPKKYGDKLDLNHAGGLNVKIKGARVESVSVAEMKAEL